MILRELFTKIGFLVDETPLNQAEKSLERLTHLLEAFASLEAFKKIFEATEKFAEWGQELNVTALNLGMNVEELQRLGIAAEHSGVSQEEMAHSMAHLAHVLYDARHGSTEAAEAFRKAGLAGQWRTFSTAEDAVMGLSDAVRASTDPIEKMGKVIALTGRGGMHMVGFLNQGSGAIKGLGKQAQDLGEILSAGQVNALEKAEHAFQRFWHILKAIGATLAVDLAPMLEKSIDWFTKLYQANKDLIAISFDPFLYAIGFAMGFTAGVIEDVTRLIRHLIEKIKEVDIAWHKWSRSGTILQNVKDIALEVLGLKGKSENLKPTWDALREDAEIIKASWDIGGKITSFLSKFMLLFAMWHGLKLLAEGIAYVWHRFGDSIVNLGVKISFINVFLHGLRMVAEVISSLFEKIGSVATTIAALVPAWIKDKSEYLHNIRVSPSGELSTYNPEAKPKVGPNEPPPLSGAGLEEWLQSKQDYLHSANPDYFTYGAGSAVKSTEQTPFVGPEQPPISEQNNNFEINLNFDANIHSVADAKRLSAEITERIKEFWNSKMRATSRGTQAPGYTS